MGTMQAHGSGGNSMMGSMQPMNTGSGMGVMGGGGSPAYSHLDEPPLLEELGIDFEHIKKKTLAVLNPTMRLEAEIINDADMSGPVFFCLLLGFLLVFSGKLQFGYIYGFFVFGCFSVYMVLNLIAQHTEIDVLRVYSVLGYSLLPIMVVALLNILFDMRGWVGTFVSFLCVGWCTLVSTRFFEKALQARTQRYLIAYPIFLLYACFALVTVC